MSQDRIPDPFTHRVRRWNLGGADISWFRLTDRYLSVYVSSTFTLLKKKASLCSTRYATST